MAQPSDKAKELKNIQGQMGAVLLTIAASIIVLMTLQGSVDRLLERHPDKDYGYLARLPIVSGFLFFLAALYYFWDTLRQRREDPKKSGIGILFAANLLALAIAGLKLELILETPRTAQAEASEEEDAGLELL